MQDKTGSDQVFRRALADGEIALPKCDSCGKFHFFPRVVCPHCHETALSWHKASGCGEVHTTTVVRRKPERGGDYNICMVELEEGVRMMSRVEGVAPADVAIGMARRLDIGPNGQPEGLVLDPDLGTPAARLEGGAGEAAHALRGVEAGQQLPAEHRVRHRHEVNTIE